MALPTCRTTSDGPREEAGPSEQAGERKGPNVKVGTIAIFGAKVFFMAAGYGLVAGLTRMLSTDEFGKYSVVFGVLALINMVLINGTMQTVSRHVAAYPTNEAGLRRRAFAYQAAFTAVLLAAFFGAAPLLGSFFKDPHLVPLLRWASIITAIYAFYAINVGYLNGKKLFLRQAILDVSFSTLKVSMILLLAWKGFGMYGVIGGFAAAAFAVFVLSFFLSGFSFSGRAVSDFPPRVFIRYAFSVMGVALLLNFVLQADLFMLKRMTAPDLADARAGLYAASQHIARIPYYLMVTAALVLFPTIASLSGTDAETVKRRAATTSSAFTAILGLLAGMAAVTMPISGRLLRVLYPAQYAPAADTLAILIGGIVLLTLVFIAVTMISGAGKPAVSIVLLGGCLTVQAIGGTLLIGTHGMEGAAAATSAAAGVTLAAAVIWMRKHFSLRIGFRVPLVVSLSAAAIAGLALAFDQALPSDASPLLTVAFCGVTYPMYLGMLLLGGVLTGAPPKAERVLLVSKPLDPPLNDGAKVFVRNLVDRLPAHEIAVCTMRGSDLELPEGVEIVRPYSGTGFTSSRMVQNLRMFAFLLINRYRYKALHFFFAPNPMTCRAIRLLRLITPGVPFVQTIMSRPKSYDRADEYLFGDVIVTHSEDTSQQLNKASRRRTSTIRPGVAPRADSNDDPRTQDLDRLGLERGAFHLLFAGDIDHGGALAHLEAMVPNLLARSPRVHFHFSVRCKGPETREKAEQFEAKTLASFPGRYTMYVDDPRFEELLKAQDAMILPAEDLYTKLDAPLVVLESMALGKPVFMLDRPPLNEIPPREDRSLLLAADADGMVDLVCAHVDAGGGSQELAERLQNRMREHFDIGHAAESYTRIYQKLSKAA